MQPLDLITQSRLHGCSIFLSASVPDLRRRKEFDPDFTRIPEAPSRIEEAIMSIARAIFMEGGTLVFGAHPSISPLVARVIQDYYLPAPDAKASAEHRTEEPSPQWKNPSLLIYQSDMHKPYWAEATRRLESHPLVTVKWTPAHPGETIDPKVTDRSQAPESLKLMRQDMITETQPLAMIAIGGMGGILKEAAIFAEKRQGQPIYAFTTTGGATALLPRYETLRAAHASDPKALANLPAIPGLREVLHAPDKKALALVQQFWAEQAVQEQQLKNDKPQDQHQRPRISDRPPAQSPDIYVPYGLVAQQVVEQIVQSLGKRQ